MCRHLFPPTEPIETVGERKRTRRAGVQKHLVIIVGCSGKNRRAIAALPGHLSKEVQIRLTKGTVVIPIISHPIVDLWIFRHGGLERRVRIEKRHYHRGAVGGCAKHADLAVGLGTFLTSQSMVSQASVVSSVSVAFSGPRGGRVSSKAPSEPYLPRTS
jgi:hypothetical protein